jgi:peptidoglycan hydrolase-like protein with peptidoglycan-binding domain
VTILQLALGTTADGKYGPRTAASVKARQQAAGLTPDAVAGPKTWTALGLR